MSFSVDNPFWQTLLPIFKDRLMKVFERGITIDDKPKQRRDTCSAERTAASYRTTWVGKGKELRLVTYLVLVNHFLSESMCNVTK